MIIEEFNEDSIEKDRIKELLSEKYNELSLLYKEALREDPMIYFGETIQDFIKKIKSTYSKEILDKCLLWYVIILASPEVKIEEATLDVPGGEIEDFIRNTLAGL